MSHSRGSPCQFQSDYTFPPRRTASRGPPGALQHRAVFPTPQQRAPAPHLAAGPALWAPETPPTPLFFIQRMTSEGSGKAGCHFLGVPALGRCGNRRKLGQPGSPPAAGCSVASGQTRAHLEAPASPCGQAALSRVGDFRPTQVLQPGRRDFHTLSLGSLM